MCCLVARRGFFLLSLREKVARMKSAPDGGLPPFLATLETTSLARGEGKITGRAMVLSAASDACESATRDTLAALWRRLRTISWAGRLTEIAILDCV